MRGFSEDADPRRSGRWRRGRPSDLLRGDAGDRIAYNQATGQVFYDADGIGAGAQVQFATLSTGLALIAADFMVI